MLWVDQAGVLSNPTDACPLGEVAFQHGTRIGVPAILHRTSSLFLDKSDEFLHPRGKNVMIVIAPGVGGDLSPYAARFDYPLFVRSAQRERERGTVWRRQNQNGFAFRKDEARVAAAEARTFLGKVIHRAVTSLGEPVFECGIMGRWFRRSYPG